MKILEIISLIGSSHLLHMCFTHATFNQDLTQLSAFNNYAVDMCRCTSKLNLKLSHFKVRTKEGFQAKEELTS